MNLGILTLAGSGTGALASLRRYLENRLKNAALIIRDAGSDPKLLEFAPENCEILELGGDAGEIVLHDPVSLRKRIRTHLEEGRSVVRLYSGNLLLSETAFEEVQGYQRFDIRFEALADLFFLENRSMDWRVQTLLHAGGLLVLPCTPAFLKDLRRSLLSEALPDGLSGIFLPEDTADRADPVALDTDSLSRELGHLERTLSGIVLLGAREEVVRAGRWIEDKPLLGMRVLVTRADNQSEGLVSRIRKLGGSPFALPTIQIVPPRSWNKLDDALQELDRFDWILFTSQNGVKGFFDRLLADGQDARAIRGVRLACVGSATAGALNDRGFHPDLVPEEFRAEPLAELLVPEAEGHRFLLPIAEEHREILPDRIREAGGEVTVAPTYRNVPPEDLLSSWESASERGFDAVTFTSSSTVRHLAAGLDTEDLGPHIGSALVACIGPITASTAKRYGLSPIPLPHDSTAERLVESLVTALQGDEDFSEAS